MHVIGHDTPGHEPIPLSLPEIESVGHQLADAWIAQETCTQAAIKILFQFCSAEFGNQQLLGRRQMSAHALCRDQNMNLSVFSIFKAGALKRVVLGEDEGTLVHC